MKEKLTKNLGMKILSLVLAMILWLVIVNIDNPVISRPFRGVPVDIINESAIISKGKVYEVVEGGTVDVVVKGKRNIVDNLNKTDIKATADLSNLIFTNAVPITLSCAKTSTVDLEIYGDVQTLKVELEDVEVKQFKITVVPKGEPESGYSIGTIQAKPNIIQVSGAKSQIAKIEQIRAEIDVSNARDTIRTTATPKAYDAKGRQIDSGKLLFSNNTIVVRASFLKTNTVKVDVTTEGEPVEGYDVVSIEYEPKEIAIAGNADQLKKVVNIPIKIDVSGKISNIETEIKVSDWLPNGVQCVDETQTIVVNVIIQKKTMKTIPFSNADIELRNLPDGLGFSYNMPEDYGVTIEGIKDNVDNITLFQLKPYIDMQGLKAGTHNIEVEFNDIEGIKVTTLPTVRVILTKNDADISQDAGNDVIEDNTEDINGDSTKEDSTEGVIDNPDEEEKVNPDEEEIQEPDENDM